MSGYSDIIKELSKTSPLNAMTSFTTEKIIAGQYSSLTISYAGDQDTTILVQFSNDGIHFDMSISKSFYNSTGYENLVILGKWIRYVISNDTGVNQTYLRIFTYGSVNNSTMNSILTTIGDNFPIVDVGNLPLAGFGEVKHINDYKLVNYIFTYGTNGAVQNTGFKTPYASLKGYSAGAFTSAIFLNGLMKMRISTGQIGVGAMIYGKQLQYSAGTSVCSRFTGRFEQYTPRNNLAPGFQYQLLGIGNENGSGVVNDFLGWGNVNTVSSSLNFGIHYFRGGSLIASYPQSSWNIDKCDGTQKMPLINFNDYINVFQIQFQYLGAGNIFFYIENPDTGLFQKVHEIIYANNYNITNLQNPSVGLIMYQRTDATGTASVDNDGIHIGSFSLSLEGTPSLSGTMDTISSSKSAISSITNVLTIRNKDLFYGIKNRLPIKLYSISGSADGTKPVSVIIRKNQALTGAVWSDVNTDYTPVEYDNTGTLSGTGRNIITYQLGKIDTLHDDLLVYELILFPGDSITITAQSTASSDVVFSITWKNL